MSKHATEIDRLRGVVTSCAAPVLVLLGLGLAGDGGRILLRFQRQSILDGEWWRLISGHWVHLGWPHTFLNLAGLVLVMTIFNGVLSPLGWAVTGLGSMLAIDLGFLWMRPDLGWYVGLSGVLHGWMAAGLLLMPPRAERWLLLGLLALKLGYEQLFGALPMTESSAGGIVVVDAHLLGAIGGLCGAGLLWLVDRGSRPV